MKRFFIFVAALVWLVVPSHAIAGTPYEINWLLTSENTDCVTAEIVEGTRWDNLDKPVKEGGLGNEGKDAKKLLAGRGLNDKIINDAKALLQQLTKVDGPLPDLEKMAAVDADYAKAEEDLWAWYLEWSTIARSAIKQRSLLLKLGFLRSNGRDDEDEEAPDATAGKTPPEETATNHP